MFWNVYMRYLDLWFSPPPQQQNFWLEPGKVMMHTKSKIHQSLPLSVFVFGPLCTVPRAEAKAVSVPNACVFR